MGRKGFLRKALVLSLVLTMLMSVNAFAADIYDVASTVLLYNANGEYGGFGGHTIQYSVVDGTDACVVNGSYNIWTGDGDYINYIPDESGYSSGSSASAHSTFRTVIGGRLVKGVAYSDCSCYGEVDKGSYYIYQ